mgnify:CR=1 FL=1
MSTLKDVLKSINHNKYSSASVLALTSLLVFRSTLAYLDYKGYGIESSTFNEAFENLAILGSFLVASVSTASTFYATKYSKERFHENMGIPFDLLYNYHNGMGHCPRAGFEIAAKDLGFEIPHTNILLIIIGGLLVGYGTQLGSGCTSGHGICGIGRLSFRSIAATFTFILTGIITVLLLRLLGFINLWKI